MTIEWTTKKIGKSLMEKSNNYTWGLEDAEYGTSLKMPSPAHPFDHTPNSKTTVKGRGTIATGLNFDHLTAEALRWWFNQLAWTPNWKDRPKERHTHAYTATYLEMVVDFETATGMTVPGSGWGNKASRMAAMLKSMARIYTIVENELSTVTWQQALEPKSGYPTLTPLGAPREPGVSRRPKWLCASTSLTVAGNIWRCLKVAPENMKTPQGYKQAVVKDHTLDRTGFNDGPIWRSGAELTLIEIKAKAYREYDDELEKWRKDRTRPIPIHPREMRSKYARLWSDSANAADAIQQQKASNFSCQPATTADNSDKTGLQDEESRCADTLAENGTVASNIKSHEHVPARRTATDLACAFPLAGRDQSEWACSHFESASSSGDSTRPTIYTSLRQLLEHSGNVKATATGSAVTVL